MGVTDFEHIKVCIQSISKRKSLFFFVYQPGLSNMSPVFRGVLLTVKKDTVDKKSPNSFNSKFKCKSACIVCTVQHLAATNASISKTMFLRQQECNALTYDFPKNMQ